MRSFSVGRTGSRKPRRWRCESSRCGRSGSRRRKPTPLWIWELTNPPSVASVSRLCARTLPPDALPCLSEFRSHYTIESRAPLVGRGCGPPRGERGMDGGRSYDVLVVGGGNAALCAAISGRQRGASVLLLEAAPKHFRGGNSRHTRNLRCLHDGPADVLTESYPESEYWEDLCQVTEGQTNEPLARRVLRD